MNAPVDKYKLAPISNNPDTDYLKSKISELKAYSNCVALEETPRLTLANIYYELSLDGTQNTMYIREALANRLQGIVDHLPPSYGLLIYDAFRSIRTQWALYYQIKEQVASKLVNAAEEEILNETKKYVNKPDEKSRFEVSPHNSGGAIDLTITYNREPIFMGSQFDDVREISRTDFFEQPYSSDWGLSENQWNDAKENRRLLYHLMISNDFVNYSEEYWHYDLGDCIWSDRIGDDWFYESMEKDVMDVN